MRSGNKVTHAHASLLTTDMLREKSLKHVITAKRFKKQAKKLAAQMTKIFDSIFKQY